jgi:hypothetical protein
MSVKLANDPIIATGAARSGTTYLIQILNRHPDIWITNEIRLFVWLHKALHELPVDQNVLYREREHFLSFLHGEMPQLIRRFYRSIKPNRRFWGDKNPHYLAPQFAGRGGLETIRALFPGSRFVNIVRDGRDVVCSGMRGEWKDFESVHFMWTSHIRQGRLLAQSLPANQYFEFRYEDLIRDDVAMARKLFDFLKIPFHRNVANFCQKQMRERTPFCKPTRDINKDIRVSEWATVLTREQKLRSLELLGTELVALGYETEISLTEAKREIALEQKLVTSQAK